MKFESLTPLAGCLEPAIVEYFPVLTAVKAPRFARPLRAVGLDLGSAPGESAFIAGCRIEVRSRRRQDRDAAAGMVRRDEPW